jgi:hypothetical protein
MAVQDGSLPSVADSVNGPRDVLTVVNTGLRGVWGSEAWLGPGS